MPRPTPASGCVHAPVRRSTCAPSRSCCDRCRQMARAARSAASSKRRSPVSRESAPNSRASVPAAAVQVMVDSVGETPSRRWIEPYGMPEGVSSAGSSRSARSSARSSRPPCGSYGASIRRNCGSAASRWAESRPPSARMVVSKRETVSSTSKERCSTTHHTRASNSVRFPSSASASRVSTSVSEKLPHPSLPVHERGSSTSAGNAFAM
mmetsp:Transcript_49070/g.150910  ORF Transcript_49070/g.150910 Transcript_49070/m.150910 type:complete len:209 (-) Transcript_49070:183-809(-)